MIYACIRVKSNFVFYAAICWVGLAGVEFCVEGAAGLSVLNNDVIAAQQLTVDNWMSIRLAHQLGYPHCHWCLKKGTSVISRTSVKLSCSHV